MSHLSRSVASAVAAIAIALAGAAVPAFAAIDPSGPDLSLTMSESATQVDSGGNLTYTLTVQNTSIVQRVCEIGFGGRLQCSYQIVAGGPVSGIVVQDTLPVGSSLQSTTSTGGFSCAASGGLVTCSGGYLPAYGSATITLNTTVATLTPGFPSQPLPNSATVNPSETINERTYTNNSATVQATLYAPPIPLALPLPDLVITNLTASAGSVPRDGTVYYRATIENIGQATAYGASLVIAGGIDAVLTGTSGQPGTAFAITPCISVAEASGFTAICPEDYSLTLAPGASAWVQIAAHVLPTATLGTWCDMHATADPYNGVQESNKNNNTFNGVVCTTITAN